ncbi:MAG: ComF family protein [Oscillospiraceae bacterium]|nr:ComF family protein [Oscillospiraceae bacterium]
MSARTWLTDLLFPPKCAFCGALLPLGEHGSCKECEKKLPYFDGTVSGAWFETCVAPLRYEGEVRKAVQRFKFEDAPFLAASFAPYLADACRYHGLHADCVSFVPVSAKRRRLRGYDQAQLLARQTARLLGLPCEKLLRKTMDNPAQSGLSAEARKANVLGVYEILPGAKIAGRRILLIDDVVTTTSTLAECSRVLLTAGAEKVLCGAFARAGQTNEKAV